MSIGIEKKQKLPTGWRWVPLKEIGPITDGDWILTADYSSDGVRLLQVGDVGIGRFVGKSSRFISHERAKQLSCTLLNPGDVLISRMPLPIGRACVLPDLGYSCITAVDVSIWRPNKSIADTNFLVHYLSSKEWFARAESLASGATRSRISRSKLEQELILLPPLAEQKRVATILSEQMSVVEKARTAAATRLKAAKELPAAYLRETFEQRLSTNTHRTVTIEEITDLVRGSSPRPQGDKRYYGGTVPRLMVADVTRDGMYVTPQIDFLTELGSTLSRPMKKDDVVMVVSGAPGLPAILATDACIHDGFVGFRNLDNNVITNRYLYHYLNYIKYTTDSHATGAIFRNLTTDQIKRIKVPIPKLEIQEKIAVELATKIKSSRKIIAMILDETNALASLPDVVLRQAFAGEL